MVSYERTEGGMIGLIGYIGLDGFGGGGGKECNSAWPVGKDKRIEFFLKNWKMREVRKTFEKHI